MPQEIVANPTLISLLPGIIVTILIMLFSGTLGGYVAFYRTNIGGNSKVRKSILYGLAASMSVPLLLSLGDSRILTNVVEFNLKFVTDYFTFAAMCLLASIFGEEFVANVSNKWLSQLEKVKTQQSNVEEALISSGESLDSSEIEGNESLSNTERAIVESIRLSGRKFRTLQQIIDGREEFNELSQKEIDHSIRVLISNELLGVLPRGDRLSAYYIKNKA